MLCPKLLGLEHDAAHRTPRDGVATTAAALAIKHKAVGPTVHGLQHLPDS